MSEGHMPIRWVFVPAAPDVPGIILGNLDDGETRPVPLYVMFLKKLKLSSCPKAAPRHDWAVHPAFLFDSPEEARKRTRKRGTDAVG